MRAASSSDDETIEHNNFKLVLLGAEAVGKTALIRQLVHNCLDARWISVLDTCVTCVGGYLC
jgi:Ni2+-binding GTPase involved in maturation of urease and hydrogenase